VVQEEGGLFYTSFFAIRALFSMPVFGARKMMTCVYICLRLGIGAQVLICTLTHGERGREGG
jgi:hypothetical protein